MFTKIILNILTENKTNILKDDANFDIGTVCICSRVVNILIKISSLRPSCDINTHTRALSLHAGGNTSMY